MNNGLVQGQGRKSPPLHRAARWLLPVIVFLIVYGSLFPFELNVPAILSLRQIATSLQFQPAWRGDTLANLLLYMPLGICLASALPSRWYESVRWTLAVLAGLMLSLSMEMSQTMVPGRVASLTDVALNATSTAIGAAGALVYQSIGKQLRLPGLFDARPAPVPLGFILLWLSSRLLPFLPTIDWQKIKDALKPVLLAPQVSGYATLRLLVGWLVVAHAVRLLWKPSHVLIVLIVLVAGTQSGRIVIIGKTLNPSELAGLLCMFALWPLLSRLTVKSLVPVLAGAIAVVVVSQGLEPWQFKAVHGSFSWFPFRASLTGSLEFNVGVLIEKCFWYGALVWLVGATIRSLSIATLAVAVLISSIECLQMWLPDRSAEITDPLIVLGMGGVIALLGRERLWTLQRKQQTVQGRPG